MTEADIAEARQRMIAMRFGGKATATGGKGTVRRKKKVASRSSAAQSDVKLSAALKKLGATNIPGIEEVNLFKEDGKVIHFSNPKVASRSSAAQSDVKLSAALKKLGATNIPGIEEVNLFKEDGKVIHFSNPKVQASIAANTYIISGPSETKPLQEFLPSIVSQLGVDNLSQLQNFAAAQGAQVPGVAIEEEDDDVPDLVEGNFEEVSED